MTTLSVRDDDGVVVVFVGDAMTSTRRLRPLTITVAGTKASRPHQHNTYKPSTLPGSGPTRPDPLAGSTYSFRPFLPVVVMISLSVELRFAFRAQNISHMTSVRCTLPYFYSNELSAFYSFLLVVSFRNVSLTSASGIHCRVADSDCWF